MTVDLVIIPAGQSIASRSNRRGAAPGYLQFLDGKGGKIGNELFLGRCNKI